MEIKISISLSSEIAPNLLTIEVKDDGCGMSDVANLLKVCITIIHTIILTNCTNDAYTIHIDT
jgi:hypothetical protein